MQQNDEFALDPDWSPKATAGLDVNEVTDGYVIHQPDCDRVHYLNHTAAIVLELCTGRVPAADMPELLRKTYDLDTALVEEVAQCLALLKKEGLIA